MDMFRTMVAREFPSDPHCLAEARRLVDDQRAIAEDVRDTVKLGLTEILANAIRHARFVGDDRISVVIRATETIVRVEVTDPGPCFDRGAVAARDLPEGGMGLRIVDEIADRWSVDSQAGCCCVWFELASA